VVFVKRAGERRRLALLGEHQDAPHDGAAWCTGANLVADTHGMARLDVLAVDEHTAFVARLPSVGARFERASRVEKLVDADAVRDTFALPLGHRLILT